MEIHIYVYSVSMQIGMQQVKMVMYTIQNICTVAIAVPVDVKIIYPTMAYIYIYIYDVIGNSLDRMWKER